MLLRDALPDPLLCVAALIGFACFVGLEVTYHRVGVVRINQLVSQAARGITRQHVFAIGAGPVVCIAGWLLNMLVQHTQ